jgi:hypothetical protein
VAFEPEGSGGDHRVGTDFLPPGRFVTKAMELAVMASAKRNRELVTDLAAQRPVLRKAQVTSVGRLAAAD